MSHVAKAWRAFSTMGQMWRIWWRTWCTQTLGWAASRLNRWERNGKDTWGLSYHFHIIFIYLNGCRHLNYLKLFWTSLVILCDLHFQPLWCMGLVLNAETDVWTEEFVNDTGWHNDTTYLKLTLVDIPYATLVSWPILGPFAQLLKQQLSVQYLLLCNGHHMTIR